MMVERTQSEVDESRRSALKLPNLLRVRGPIVKTMFVHRQHQRCLGCKYVPNAPMLIVIP